MTTRMIGVLLDGATGRLGTTQHLRALTAIRGAGGLPLTNGDRLVPEPLLLGRDPERLAALATREGGLEWSTDRDLCLADPAVAIYFDVAATSGRAERVRAAIAALKHVYVEKPLAESLAETLDLARQARQAGVRSGVVQDKLHLPGLRKLKKLYDAGFFGRIVGVHDALKIW